MNILLSNVVTIILMSPVSPLVLVFFPKLFPEFFHD